MDLKIAISTGGFDASRPVEGNVDKEYLYFPVFIGDKTGAPGRYGAAHADIIQRQAR